MKANQLNRIFNLIRKSSERLLVVDSESDEVFVLMKLKDYEGLVGDSVDDYSEDDLYHEGDLAASEDYFAPVSKKPQYQFNQTKSGLNSISGINSETNFASDDYENLPHKLDFDDDMEWLHDESLKTSDVTEDDLSDLEEEEEKFYLEPVEP
jgi:hypothetical protein